MKSNIDVAPHFSLHGKSASASEALALIGRIAWNPRVFSLLSVLLDRGDGDHGGGSEGGTLRGRGDERSRPWTAVSDLPVLLWCPLAVVIRCVMVLFCFRQRADAYQYL